MPLYTPGGHAVLRPEQVGELLVMPVQRESVAMQVATTVTTTSHDFRVPVVVADPAAGWVTEGAEINVSDADLDEVLVVPAKVAGLSIISRELADDSSPAAAQVVGDGLSRDIARKVDLAFFGNLTAPAPAGLESLTGISTATYANGGPADLDWAAEAISLAEQEGADVTAFVTDPSTALSLATLRTDSDTSNVPLLSSDPTAPTRKLVAGVPLWTSPAVTPGTIWAIPRPRVLVVIRQDATIDVSNEAFFSSDRVAIRAVMRVGFAFAHRAALVKIVAATP